MSRRPSSPDAVRAARAAVRVTVAASAGFYPAVYVLDEPTVALYALFAPVSLGILSRIPGSGRDRAVVVLRVLPVAAALTALGTALAVATLPAVAGMLLVGFALSFGAVCGPAAAGVAPGLLLFYILACFPPYTPEALPQRLAGLVAGCLLLALCEWLLLPEPADVPYRERLARALDAAARAARASSAGGPPDPARAGDLRAAGQALRLSRLPPAVRPTGAGRTPRALAHAGAATRRLLDQLARSAERASPPPGRDPVSATLVCGIAAECALMARNLRGARPVAGAGLLEEMVEDFLRARVRPPDGRSPVSAEVRRRQSAVLAQAASAVTARAALSIGIGGRRAVPGLPAQQLWYAAPSSANLLLRRVNGNLTLRSVAFQNALRTALGLGAARLVAGSLDLSHGFWVLLAVLTLGRTTAGATWSAVRSAAAGTLAGALAAGALVLWAGGTTDVYAALLAPVMLLAFAVGPPAGLAWAQGLFTLVVSTAFAQLAPVTWRIGEARVVDVLTGCCIGLLCGVLAWPAGAATEVRRGMAGMLREAASLVPATVTAALAPAQAGAGGAESPEAGGRAGPDTLHRLRLAEAAYAQYRSEPGGGHRDGGPDWPAAVNCAVHILVGAHWLPRNAARDTADGGVPAAVGAWAHGAANATAAAVVEAAGFPPGGVRAAPARLPADLERAVPARELPLLLDVEQWLGAVSAELTALGGDGPAPAAAHHGGRTPADRPGH
ncbi:FUSC family protein [Streptomyces genisteinicus]|uniref:FUSC family protein n=1 Tax=Streptomyces genisteinicus TaxID=2768068 RepID=A0A7H0I2R3_9ACTN|nr:FUSC family protein [Streptomyces genisteinicus]QNP67079.1 FUSC family protein [Streptomyces genisteinicus]